jgi:hypothetical protein
LDVPQRKSYSVGEKTEFVLKLSFCPLSWQRPYWPDVTMSLSAVHSTPDGWFMVSQYPSLFLFFPMYAFHWLQMNLQKYSPSIQLLSFSVYFSNSYFIDKCKEICFISTYSLMIFRFILLLFTSYYVQLDISLFFEGPTGHFY